MIEPITARDGIGAARRPARAAVAMKTLNPVARHADAFKEWTW